MSIKNQLDLVEDVSANHAFWYGEVFKAWHQMLALSFDLSEGSTERFNAAKDRLELARSRCTKEMERLPKT